MISPVSSRRSHGQTVTIRAMADVIKQDAEAVCRALETVEALTATSAVLRIRNRRHVR